MMCYDIASRIYLKKKSFVNSISIIGQRQAQIQIEDKNVQKCALNDQIANLRQEIRDNICLRQKTNLKSVDTDIF